MLEARELRIGNLVKRLDDICVISLCCKSHFNATNLENGIDYGNNHQSNFQPIPLTEEWLVKLGGIIKKDAVLFAGVHFDYEDGILYFKSENNGRTDKEIKFVHRLQNFYYELTDTELCQ